MVSGPKRVDIAFDAVSAMAQSNRSKAAAARVRPLSSAGQAARSRWDQGFESGFLQRGVRNELLIDAGPFAVVAHSSTSWVEPQ